MAFEVISERPINDSKTVSSAISKKALEFLGELGCAEAGIMILNDKFNSKRQRGLIRVDNRSQDKLRATLSLIEQIDGQDVIVRSVGASGMIKKAEAHYITA